MSNMVTSQAECEASIKPHQQIDEGVFCKTVWDTLLCWPPTQAGEAVFLNCPSIIGFDKNNFCSSTPCVNNATCVNILGTYQCVCVPGYTGRQCQTDIDECASSPCLHGATCRDGINAYTCECPYVYTGQRCENKKDLCASSPCPNNSTCVNTEPSYICQCPAGYTGQSCQTDIDECASSPCYNSATCRDGVNAYTCECPFYYSGRQCEKKFAHRRCSPSGQWETKHGNVSEKGWTNFTTCFTKMGKKAEEIFFKGKTDEEIQTMKDIAEWIRHEEVFGLSLSMVTLTISLVIFFRFRSLNCHRTKIHRNLFFAILTQVIIRLMLYIDQYMGRALGGVSAGVQIGTTNTIHDTPVLCEVAVTILEYSSTVMFMWLFIEGLYLHNQITVSVFTSSPKFLLFYFIGWGFPFVPTIIWGLVVGFAYEEEMKNDRCWFGYEFMPVYWIIQGPRTAAIGINIIFLCNIIRVLVTKLKESRTSEVEQVRKAVKAAILLLPLLGTTNILSCVQAPVQTVVGFAVYSFIAHFMMSLQGFFVALLYCFMNGEVRKTLGRQWNHYRSRWRKGGRRQSRSLSFYTSETEVQMNGLLKTNGTKAKNQYKVKLGPITSNSMATETDAML